MGAFLGSTAQQATVPMCPEGDDAEAAKFHYGVPSDTKGRRADEDIHFVKGSCSDQDKAQQDAHADGWHPDVLTKAPHQIHDAGETDQ